MVTPFPVGPITCSVWGPTPHTQTETSAPPGFLDEDRHCPSVTGPIFCERCNADLVGRLIITCFVLVFSFAPWTVFQAARDAETLQHVAATNEDRHCPSVTGPIFCERCNADLVGRLIITCFVLVFSFAPWTVFQAARDAETLQHVAATNENRHYPSVTGPIFCERCNACDDSYVNRWALQ